MVLLRTAGMVRYVVLGKECYPCPRRVIFFRRSEPRTLLIQNVQRDPREDPNSLIHDREGVGSPCDTYVAPDGRIQEARSTRDTIILLAHLFLLYSDMEPEH